jgi:catechol 2,3-dioxygenase
MHFYVDDLTKAASFYVTGLGFRTTITRFPGALFVAAGGYHHHVGLNTWAAGSPVATDDDAKLLEWELVLPDETALRQTLDSLTDGGIEPVEVEDGWRARDDWGITVRLRAMITSAE